MVQDVCLGLFWALILGTFLVLPRLSWSALDPKILDQNMVFKVFENAGFRYFENLDGCLGRIMAPLGLINSQSDLLK